MKKSRQHYVWEHYLSAWAVDGKLYCDHAGRRFPASTNNVAIERDFYRLQDMSDMDLFVVEQLASRMPEPTPQIAKQWISLFRIPFELYGRLCGRVPNKESAEIFDEALNNWEENVHAEFEAKAIPILASWRNRDGSVFSDEPSAINAAMFLGLQYMRTPAMLNRLSQVRNDIPGFNLQAAWGLLRVIYATGFARALFARQSQTHATFLIAEDQRFITGDQPIVNLPAITPGTAESDVELFYPLDPQNALLLTFDAIAPTTSQLPISGSEVRRYNSYIATARYQQLYAAQLDDFG